MARGRDGEHEEAAARGGPGESVAAAAGGAVVCLVTFPDEETAARVGRALVEERLAACVNLVPRIRSIYRWQGSVCDEAEVLAVVKTTAERCEALRVRVVALHPYEVPEVVALPIAAAHTPYLEWLRAAVRPG